MSTTCSQPQHMTFPLTFMAVSLLAWVSSALANDLVEGDSQVSVSRLFTASDLPGLARGVRLPKSGTYTIQLWTSRSLSWSLISEPQTASLVLDGAGDDDPVPVWQTVGALPIKAGEPFRLTIVGLGPEPEPLNVTGDYRTGRTTIKGDPPARVPDLIALSTDPDFAPSRALDVARGRLDIEGAPQDFRRSEVRTNHEGADFQVPATLDGWRRQSGEVRRQLLVTLGLWPLPPRTPLNPRVYGKMERDGYTIEKVILETFPGFTLSGNLYRPRGHGTKGTHPGLLCPHGHYADGRVNPEVQSRCIQWARLGCVVFSYDMVGYSDSKPFGHAFLNDRLRRWGLSLVTLQTWNSLRVLDWITTLPDVDATRIGCTGSSGGGTQTFLLTAIDDRIKVAAPVVMVSDTFQGGCVCENCAGLRHGIDNVNIAALAAPRPLKLVGATGDWTAKTMSNAFPALREVYDLYGVPNQISADVFDFPHNYNRTSREAVYDFLAPRLLLGTGKVDTTEHEPSMEDPENLFTFDDEHPRPSYLLTPEQLESELIQVRGRQLDQLAPNEHAASWQASRSLLETSLQVRVGVSNPSAGEIVATTIRESKSGPVSIIHHEVGRADTGERIPAVRLVPREPTGQVVVLFTDRGKASLVSADGSWTPLVRALLGRGQTVVGFDPLLVGESLDPNGYALRRPDTAHYDTYNPSLPADRMQDLATVTAWARFQPETKQVALVAPGRWSPLALLGLPAFSGIDRAAIDLHGFDYGDGSGEIPSALDLPGVLQFGGLKSAASLAAPLPLWISRPGSSRNVKWPSAAYELAGSRQRLRLDPRPFAPKAVADWLADGTWPVESVSPETD